MIIKTLQCFFIVPIFFINYCLGQTVTNDTTTQKAAIVNVVNAYNHVIGEQSRLYNGPEYELYDPIIKGNAYFLDINAFKPGNVNYDGIYYPDVPIMYDLNKDEVVVLLYNNFSKFSLLSNRVQSFDLSGHHFVYLTADTLHTTFPINTGFYDEAYRGKLQLFVKWSKSIQTATTSTTIESYFSPKKSIYLKKDEKYYSVSGQGNFLKVLKDKKKELLQYIRANNITFDNNPEKAMYMIVARYDQLSK